MKIIRVCIPASFEQAGGARGTKKNLWSCWQSTWCSWERRRIQWRLRCKLPLSIWHSCRCRQWGHRSLRRNRKGSIWHKWHNGRNLLQCHRGSRSGRWGQRWSSSSCRTRCGRCHKPRRSASCRCNRRYCRRKSSSRDRYTLCSRCSYWINYNIFIQLPDISTSTSDAPPPSFSLLHLILSTLKPGN